VVDIASLVPSRGAVDGPSGAHLEEIACIASLGHFGIRNAWTDIFDDELALVDHIRGEKTETGFRSSDP
jgi:hypothetical protein